MSTLDPPVNPADQLSDATHPSSAKPHPQDAHALEDEKKVYVAQSSSADNGAKSDLEKGSSEENGTHARDTELMAPPKGPPYGEVDEGKPEPRWSVGKFVRNKWFIRALHVFLFAVLLGW